VSDERGLLPAGFPPTEDADRAALRRAREASSLSPREYLAFLRALVPPQRDELRRRQPLRGEPFTLTSPESASKTG
jgi:hypothetical protein